MQKENSLKVQRHVSHWQTSYWTERGFSKEEAIEKVSEIQSSNSRNSVEYTVSKASTRFLDDLSEKLRKEIKREESILDFTVDGFIPELKVVIEYYGVFWHCHPSLFESEDIHPVTGWKVASKWAEDGGRIKKLKAYGYKVFIVWEGEELRALNEINDDLTRG